jgi:hypothetical protein
MRLQRRQTRFEELPASEVCSFSLEDALCATHLLSQVLSMNRLPQLSQRRPTRTNELQLWANRKPKIFPVTPHALKMQIVAMPQKIERRPLLIDEFEATCWQAPCK